GGQRPLAILVLEDKIVQRAVAMILEAIYEPYFYEFSFGFRRHFSAHGALIYVRQQCLKLGINWIIDADIRKFFDTISWEQLRRVLQKARERRRDSETDRDVAARGRTGARASGESGIGHSPRGADFADTGEHLSARGAG